MLLSHQHQRAPLLLPAAAGGLSPPVWGFCSNLALSFTLRERRGSSFPRSQGEEAVCSCGCSAPGARGRQAGSRQPLPQGANLRASQTRTVMKGGDSRLSPAAPRYFRAGRFQSSPGPGPSGDRGQATPLGEGQRARKSWERRHGTARGVTTKEGQSCLGGSLGATRGRRRRAGAGGAGPLTALVTGPGSASLTACR